MYTTYFPSMGDSITIEQGVSSYATNHANHQSLESLYSIIASSTGVTYGDITWDDISAFSTEIEDSGIVDYSVYQGASEWWAAINATSAGDNSATYQEICSFMVNEFDCQVTQYEAEEAQKVVDEQEDRYSNIEGMALNEWYRIDLDRDEMISWDDFRTARDATTYTDDSITHEFNHYDTDMDGVVTRDEAWEVKK